MKQGFSIVSGSFKWMWIVVFCVAMCYMPVKATGLFKNSVGVANGFYAAEGFGTNYYLGLRYNHYYSRWHYFVEGAIGFSSIKSQVLDDLAAFSVFENDGLFTYEFMLGYDYKPLGSLPYVTVGVAGVNQGGQSKFAMAFGLGKHIPLAQFFKVKKLGIRYDIRDFIFKQQINNATSFTSHNLSFTLSLQYYF